MKSNCIPKENSNFIMRFYLFIFECKTIFYLKSNQSRNWTGIHEKMKKTNNKNGIICTNNSTKYNFNLIKSAQFLLLIIFFIYLCIYINLKTIEIFYKYFKRLILVVHNIIILTGIFEIINIDEN